jgi:hypothetical protein
VTIQDLGSLGELIAAVATVATLIYLAAQIRQNTSTVATSTYESVFSGYNDVNLAVASDPILAGILERGVEDPTSLEASEQFRFFLLMRSVSNQYLKLLRLTERGAFPAVEWETYAQEVAHLYRTPGGILFRSHHPNYADLYQATDGIRAEDVSPMRFDEPRRQREDETPGTSA